MTTAPQTTYSEKFLRAFAERGPEEFICRGHPTGDVLEAWRWRVTSEEPGRLRIRAPLPDRLRNVKGQLFGGFTPVLVDRTTASSSIAIDDIAAPAERQADGRVEPPCRRTS